MNAALRRVLLLQGHIICCYFCLSTGYGYFAGIRRYVSPTSIFAAPDTRDHWLIGGALLVIAIFGLLRPFPGSILVAFVGAGLRGYDAVHQGNLLLLGTYVLAITFGVVGSYVYDREQRATLRTQEVYAEYSSLAGEA